MTTVVNLRHSSYDIYIGRVGHGQDGYFGNPFGAGTRNQNIREYVVYFTDRITNDDEFRRRVEKLRDKTLGCFCAPLPCHGDVIVEYLELSGG